MTERSENRPAGFKISALQVGAVRVQCSLAPEESRHDLFIRDWSPQMARRHALELLQAAEEAELNDARYGRA